MLRRCPKCKKDGGLVYCPVCHGVKRDKPEFQIAVDALQAIATGAPGTDYEFGYNDDAIVPMNLANRALKQLKVS